MLTLALATAAGSVTAQIRGSNITVTVTPDHKDWTYQTGEKIEFTVCVLK